MFKSGTPAEIPGQLTRSSLGQSANIGDLYDARTDRFTGQSVASCCAEPLAINTTPMESYQEQIFIDGIVFGSGTSLVNEKQLQLSVLLSLVERCDVIPTSCALLRTAATLHEQVCNLTDIEGLISSHNVTLGKATATHVVVGVVWGANVTVCIDSNDTFKPISSGQSADGHLQHLQMMISMLQSGVQSHSQVLTDVVNSYTIKCFSNCLSPRYTSLENATALLSNVRQLIHSVNNGKGAPLWFILVPLSSLIKCPVSLPIRVEELLLTQTLAQLREVTMAKHTLAGFSQYVGIHKNHLEEREVRKINKFEAGFQQAVKMLHRNISRDVIAIRSGHLPQSRLVDTIHAFSRGCCSYDSLRKFLDSIDPTLQKMDFFDKLLHEGISIIGSSRTDLRKIICGEDAYILFATERAKCQHPELWEENSNTFLDAVRQEKRKNAKTPGNVNAAKFAYADCNIVRGVKIDKEIAIYHYKHDQILSCDVAAECAIVASRNIAQGSHKKQPQPFMTRPAKRTVIELP